MMYIVSLGEFYSTLVQSNCCEETIFDFETKNGVKDKKSLDALSAQVTYKASRDALDWIRGSLLEKEAPELNIYCAIARSLNACVWAQGGNFWFDGLWRWEFYRNSFRESLIVIER